MPVRKTESRQPDGFGFADLGQFAAAAGNKIALVSFFSSPCALRQTQVYVVFVADTTVAPNVGKYEWTFTNGGPPTQQTTDDGIAQFTPQNLGALSVTVKLKGSGGAVLQTLNLSQQVIALNNDLEVLIDQQESNVPDAAHPDTSREIVNDVRGYVDVMLSGAANELYNKAVSSLAYVRCLNSEQFKRHLELERIANVINSGNHKDFLSETRNGFGICKTRPQMLAMFLKHQGAPYIALVELPDAKSKRPAAEKAIAKAFNDPTQVTEEHKIDLFNLLRFPKSHLTMVKLVIDELQARYFKSATAVPDVLKEKAKAGSLLTQFEIGPIAMGGSFGVTADSGKIVKLFGHKIWTITVAPIAGAGGGGGAVVPGPVGTPEDAPDVTFIAEQSPSNPPGSGGFLGQATAYHTTFGLSPQVAKSFEGMLVALKALNAPIGRLRIVSHFSLDPKAKTAQVFIPMFDNQVSSTNERYFHTDIWHFEYGTSDEAGLLAFFKNELIPFQKPGFLSTVLKEAESTSPTARQLELHAILFKILKNRSDPSLAPFKFKAAGPAGAALNLVQWAADLFALDNVSLHVKGDHPVVADAPLAAAIVSEFKTFARDQIDKLKTTSGVMIKANVDPLVTAITSLKIADLPTNTARTTLGSPSYTIGGVFLANHTTMRTNLAAVRAQLKDGFVDVRGCRIGQDTAYMNAMRTFFGAAGHEPRVSGPQWFHSFTIKSQVGAGDEFTIDSLFSSGHAPVFITGADVQRAYQDWSGMVGLGAQLSFWAQLFDSDKIAFLARKWTDKLPPIGMDAAQVKNLSALSYPNLLVRLRDIFFIPATTGPTAAEANAFNTGSMGNVTTLNNEIDAVDQLPANATQAALQARLTALQALATSMGQTLPTPTPNPLTVDFLKQCIAALSGPLVTASKIDPLLVALHGKAGDPKFGVRYMLSVGLPLTVQSAARENEMSFLFYTPRLTDAFKSLAGIHWRNPPPLPVKNAIAALNPTGTAVFDPVTGLPLNDTAKIAQVSQLSKENSTTSTTTDQVTINPEDEFASLITRVP